MTFYEITEADRELIGEAMATLQKNFDAVNHFHIVGAAVRCTDGAVFTGVNCDGIHGSCAEYVAVGAAVNAGYRAFDTIVATHLKAPNGVVSPCGNCRQMLFTYDPEVRVIVNNDEGELVKVGIRDLLPFAYEEIPLD